MRERIAAFCSGAPVFFISVVLGIALCFRLTIGAIRPDAADAAESPPSAAAAPERALAPVPLATSDEAKSATVGAPTHAPAPTPPSTPSRRKPRAHGKR
jgi:hypothetical protein